MPVTVSRTIGNDGDTWTMTASVTCPYGNEWPTGEGYDGSHLIPVVKQMIEAVNAGEGGPIGIEWPLPAAASTGAALSGPVRHISVPAAA
jgi:hypothetical protein